MFNIFVKQLKNIVFQANHKTLTHHTNLLQTQNSNTCTQHTHINQHQINYTNQHQTHPHKARRKIAFLTGVPVVETHITD